MSTNRSRLWEYIRAKKWKCANNESPLAKLSKIRLCAVSFAALLFDLTTRETCNSTFAKLTAVLVTSFLNVESYSYFITIVFDSLTWTT